MIKNKYILLMRAEIVNEYAESMYNHHISSLYRKHSPGRFTEQALYMCIYRHGQTYIVSIFRHD